MNGALQPVLTVCTPDGSARFVIFRRQADLFEVWLQRRETDPVYHPGESWYVDIREGAYFAATLDDAARIGTEGLRNLTSAPD